MDIQQRLTEWITVLRALKSNDKALLAAAVTLTAYFVLKTFFAVSNFIRISRGLATIPSAPGCNALLGHVLPLLAITKTKRATWDLMEDWLDEKEPIVKFRIVNTHGVIVAEPLALKRVFQQRFKQYVKDLDLSYRPFLPILGTGLVTSDGDLWQKQRLLMTPALRVDILDVIVKIAFQAVKRFNTKLKSYKGTGQPVDIEEEFRLLTLQVIGEAILSLPPEECDRVFPQLYLPVMEEGHHRVLQPYRKYLPTPSWFQFNWRMRQLNKYIIDIIRQRWRQRQEGRLRHTDILERILESIEKNGTKWTRALEEQLCYEIKTFLLAGHETSAAMLTWSIYELIKAPDCMKKVQEEALHTFGPEPQEPSRQAVDNMVYSLAVLKEALRKYSVVPVVTRKLTVDDELLGHPIPAGTMVVLHLQKTHNMWKDPRSFNPDRFLEGGEYDQFEENIRPYMFVPFIQGPRNCLGQHMALLEARVVLSMVCKEFKFRVVHPDAGARHHTVVPVSCLGGMELYID